MNVKCIALFIHGYQIQKVIYSTTLRPDLNKHKTCFYRTKLILTFLMVVPDIEMVIIRGGTTAKITCTILISDTWAVLPLSCAVTVTIRMEMAPQS